MTDIIARPAAIGGMPYAKTAHDTIVVAIVLGNVIPVGDLIAWSASVAEVTGNVAIHEMDRVAAFQVDPRDIIVTDLFARHAAYDAPEIDPAPYLDLDAWETETDWAAWRSQDA